MEDKWTETSGNIPNPGKRFFLYLAVKCLNAVNRQSDGDRASYARKAMILTGMALNVNGQGEQRQLLPKLTQIIQTDHAHFDGTPVERY